MHWFASSWREQLRRRIWASAGPSGRSRSRTSSTEIEARLEAMKASGELATHAPRGGGTGAESASRRLPASRASAPRAFSRHPPCSILRSRSSATSGQPTGRLIAARGTRINPLEKHPLTRDLLFIDGTRPVEVEWAIAREKPSVIVLLAGRPLELMRAHGRAFFFDQGGRLARRFGLAATPSLLEAEGSFLRITEVPLEDEENARSEGDRP